MPTILIHKLWNVMGHLPERLHASVGKALRDAWELDSANRAVRVLERLAGSLEPDHPGAAASIREGLEKTLTVQRLGLTGALLICPKTSFQPGTDRNQRRLEEGPSIRVFPIRSTMVSYVVNGVPRQFAVM